MLSFSVFDPITPQTPLAELLTDLRLPGTTTIVVLHGIHQAILPMNAGTLVVHNAQLKWRMHAKVMSKLHFSTTLEVQAEQFLKCT